MRFKMSEMRQVLKGSSRLNQMTKEIKHLSSIIDHVFESARRAKDHPIRQWRRDPDDDVYNIRVKRYTCAAPKRSIRATYVVRAQITSSSEVTRPEIWLEPPAGKIAHKHDEGVFTLGELPRELVSLVHATLPSLLEQLANEFPVLAGELKFWMKTAQE